MNGENSTEKKPFDPSKLRIAGQGNMGKAEGFQPSVWDVFKNSFPKPGDYLEWEKDAEDGMTGQQAGQLAARMRVLHPGVYFHSGVNTAKEPNTVFVRRREEGWLPSKLKKEMEEKEKAEVLARGEKYEQPELAPIDSEEDE